MPVDSSGTAIAPWRLLASALLEAEALRRRLSGVVPRDFAGLVIDDAEIDRLLSELPGLEGRPVDLASVEAGITPLVAAHRAAFVEELRGDDAFACIARHAHLDAAAAELLALIAAVEVTPSLQRLVGYVQDNVSAPRLWLATVLASLATVGMPGLVGIGMLALVAEPLGLPFSAISILILATFPIIDPVITVANVYLNIATGVVAAGRADDAPFEAAIATPEVAIAR